MAWAEGPDMHDDSLAPGPFNLFRELLGSFTVDSQTGAPRREDHLGLLRRQYPDLFPPCLPLRATQQEPPPMANQIRADLDAQFQEAATACGLLADLVEASE